jgi:hypothetical protein
MGPSEAPATTGPGEARGPMGPNEVPPAMGPGEGPDPGGHLRRIWRAQLALLPLGALAWAADSAASSAFFLAGGVFCLAAWPAHCWTVGKMLSASMPLGAVPARPMPPGAVPARPMPPGAAARPMPSGAVPARPMRRRWFFGLAGAARIVLIAVALGAIIKHSPAGALPFATGALLYVAAIVAEAAWLVLAGAAGPSSPSGTSGGGGQ